MPVLVIFMPDKNDEISISEMAKHTVGDARRLSPVGGVGDLAGVAATGRSSCGLGWVGADLFGMALLAALLLYAFPLLVHFDYGVKTSLRDGWILAVRFPVHTLGLLGLGILGAFAVGYLSLGLLLLLPALYGLFVVGNTLLVLQTTEPNSK